VRCDIFTAVSTVGRPITNAIGSHRHYTKALLTLILTSFLLASPLAAVAQPATQEASLFEEDADHPTGHRLFGSARWHKDTVAPGPGLSPELAIRVDVKVPERKLALTLSLRRNSDVALPASHVVEIIFNLPADLPAGDVARIPGLLVKETDIALGTPLVVVAVKQVARGSFLIGLSNQGTERERNIALLKASSWLSIPIIYADKHRALLVIEKGATGELTFAETFNAWKQ
jgi:hypothetical protein